MRFHQAGRRFEYGFNGLAGALLAGNSPQRGRNAFLRHCTKLYSKKQTQLKKRAVSAISTQRAKQGRFYVEPKDVQPCMLKLTKKQAVMQRVQGMHGFCKKA
jgi:hypothetical protein